MKLDRILVAVNDSEQALWAVEAAAELASQVGASLLLLHVVNRQLAFPSEVGVASTELLTDMREEGTKLLERARRRVPAGIEAHTALREGRPAHEIIEGAREAGAGMIFIGTHGRGRLSAFLIGSTTEAVIREAQVPVVAVRQPVHATVL